MQPAGVAGNVNASFDYVGNGNASSHYVRLLFESWYSFICIIRKLV
jgi:hypothetical protein